MMQLRELYLRLLKGECSPEDQAAFIELLMEPEREEEARALLTSIAEETAVPTLQSLSSGKQEMLADSILAATGHLQTITTNIPKAAAGNSVATAKRIRINWKWAGVAAALILIAGAVVYTWLSGTSQRIPDIAKEKGLEEVIAPGGNRAILTLADGSQIILDSAANGTLASQGSASVVKLMNGQIAYSLQGSPLAKTMMNTMTTPRGGQYMLILPDGTKVWLNATSSITYPVSFTGSQREVSVRGEAYFEVAENKFLPFRVNIGNGTAVEVLGTHFNVNTFADEGTLQTTLLEGSVRVTRNIAGQKEDAVVIKPGQQAQLAIGGGLPEEQRLQVISRVNVERVVAWKNGIFYFQEAGLPQVMKQLERWYDINVRFTGKVPVLAINGKMDRGLTLQELLEFLTKMEVRCHLEGRTIIVEGN